MPTSPSRSPSAMKNSLDQVTEGGSVAGITWDRSLTAYWEGVHTILPRLISCRRSSLLSLANTSGSTPSGASEASSSASASSRGIVVSAIGAENPGLNSGTPGERCFRPPQPFNSNASRITANVATVTARKAVFAFIITPPRVFPNPLLYQTRLYAFPIIAGRAYCRACVVSV